MIYFCIPAYNEERTVGVVLWKLRQVMAELARDYQIIVVDDASTDSTPSVLNPYIRVLPLTVMRNPERRGYADSLEIAIREALRRSPYPKRDAVITLQADFTEDPDVVPALVKRVEAGADVVATGVTLEPGAPRSLRWAQTLVHWLLRKRAWAVAGDPLSGLRAYRVIVLKRAAEARPGGRLLTWGGHGANIELLAQAVPHARRTDSVDTTLKHHRLQRASRFAFMTAWRDLWGAARGKPNANAKPLPADSVIAMPQPIAVEAPKRPRERDAERPARRSRGERPPQRREKRARTQPASRPQEKPAAEAAAAADETAKRARKRKRPRRRKEKQPSDAPALVVEGAPEPEPAQAGAEPLAAVGNGEAPKKKSRRGRRGGRGRRRGPRPNGTNGESQGEAAEAPPPLAAEGD